MRYGLGVIPDVRAGTGAAACAIVTALKTPKSAVRLAQNCGGFKYCQIGSYRLNYFVGQCCVVEAIAELGARTPQF